MSCPAGLDGLRASRLVHDIQGLCRRLGIAVLCTARGLAVHKPHEYVYDGGPTKSPTSSPPLGSLLSRLPPGPPSTSRRRPSSSSSRTLCSSARAASWHTPDPPATPPHPTRSRPRDSISVPRVPVQHLRKPTFLSQIHLDNPKSINNPFARFPNLAPEQPCSNFRSEQFSQKGPTSTNPHPSYLDLPNPNHNPILTI